MGAGDDGARRRALEWHARETTGRCWWLLAWTGLLVACWIVFAAWPTYHWGSTRPPSPLWVALPLMGVGAAWMTQLVRALVSDNRRLRVAAGFCPWCKYKRDVPADLPCPECGRRLGGREPRLEESDEA